MIHPVEALLKLAIDKRTRPAGKLCVALLVITLGLKAQTPVVEKALLAIQDALQAGDLDTASQLTVSALGEHPGDGGLLNLRGIIHARRDELSQARSDFQEAVRAAPGLAPAWKNLARACQLQAGRDAESVSCAIDSWQHVERLQSADTEAHSSLARLLADRHRYAASLNELARLPAEAAARSANLIVRCADLAALGRVAESSKIAAQLAGRPDFSEPDFVGVKDAFGSAEAAPVVITLVEGLDSRQGAGVISLQRLAVAFEQMHRPQDARKTLERAAMLDPKNTAHLLELARLADETNDYEGALGYLGHARDLAPGDPQIHFLFAMIASKMNLPIEARSSLERALALDPQNPAYNYAMGFVILSTRDAATAAGYFQKFVNAKPREVKGYYALGVAHFAAGDYLSAKTEMNRARNDSHTAGGAEYFLGRMARSEGDDASAARHLRRSIELMPDYAESHTELARILMGEGDLKGAHIELDRAVQLDPRSFQANSQLLVWYRRTRDNRAEKQAQVVKQLDEDRSKRAELMLRTIEVRP